MDFVILNASSIWRTNIEELSHSIHALVCGKTPGEYNILPEIIKSSDPVSLRAAYSLLSLYWGKGKVPQSWMNPRY